MICKFISFWLVLFVVLHAAQAAPHLYRRHHSYYHHRSPYHVNYSPFSLPKRTYFGVESSAFANDLEEPVSSDQVKGGVKNSNQNQIKTPMKLFSERKNGYQFGGLSSLQEKFSEAKRANPGSLKSQQTSPDNSVIYPPIDSDLNEETAHLPVLELNKKPAKGSAKGFSDAKSKVNNKNKQTSQIADALFSSTIQPALDESPLKIGSPVKIEAPTKLDGLVKDENSKESSNVVSNEAAISNESSPDVKTNSLDSKVFSPSSTEQPATTLSVSGLSPSAILAVNSESSLEIKEVKVDISEANVVKLELSDAPKSEAKPKTDVVKLESIAIKPERIIKPESNSPESVVNKIEKVEAPVKSAGIVSSVPETVAKVDAQPASEPKPLIGASAEPTDPVLDVRKKPSVGEVIDSAVVAIIPEQTVPKTETNVVANVSPIAEPSPAKSVSSVDVPPASPVSAMNTESSLVLENETDSPLIN